MPIADAANVDDLPSPGLNNRLDALEHGVVRADHRVQRALPRLLGGAAQRSVDEIDAPRRKLSRESSCRDRIGCRAIDDYRSLFQAGCETVGPADNALNFRRTG